MAKILKAQAGHTMHIFDTTTKHVVERQLKRALNRGEEVNRISEGYTEWITIDPLFDLDKEGSEVFEWDSTGNKIKCWTTLHTKDNTTGEITKRVIRRGFVSYDKAMDF